MPEETFQSQLEVSGLVPEMAEFRRLDCLPGVVLSRNATSLAKSETYFWISQVVPCLPS